LIDATIDVEFSVAEEVIQEKQRTNSQRRRKQLDRLKAERSKESIKLPQSTKQAFDLRRVKKLTDLPED
jgi:hypothetical protein